jgi:iron uptake system component EfeO
LNNGCEPLVSVVRSGARSYGGPVRRLVLVSGLGFAVLLAGCSTPSSRSSGSSTTAPTTRVDISVSQCGRGWSTATSGWQSFTLRDSDSRAAEVTLVDPVTGAVFATLEPLGPGRSADLAVQLDPGRYAFRCAMEDEPVVTGPAVVVTGPPVAAPAGVLPVTEQDLLPATRAYTSYVTGRLPELLRSVQRLRADLSRHARAAAERDWLAGHLDYERLGAAYGAFGDADGAINGLPSSWPKGLRDRGFTGFHRIEYDLWHGASFPVLTAEAGDLVHDVAALRAAFRTAQIDPLDVSIRAHEITENALEFELTGRTDFGSHSSLATVDANLAGTRTVVGLLTALLKVRYAGLDATLSALSQAQADVSAQRRDGRWISLTALPQPIRERIDSDLSRLTELLAPVASILEPRRDT